MASMLVIYENKIIELKAENKRLRDFIESITDATGPYPELNGKPIVSAAYKSLQKLIVQGEKK